MKPNYDYHPLRQILVSACRVYIIDSVDPRLIVSISFYFLGSSQEGGACRGSCWKRCWKGDWRANDLATAAWGLEICNSLYKPCSRWKYERQVSFGSKWSLHTGVCIIYLMENALLMTNFWYHYSFNKHQNPVKYLLNLFIACKFACINLHANNTFATLF